MAAPGNPREPTFELELDLTYRFELQPRPRLVWISPSVTAITGYAADEFLADDELYRNLEIQRSAKQSSGDPEPGSRLIPGLHRCRRKDGAALWLDVHLPSLRAESERITVVDGLARDVTQIVELTRLESAKIMGREVAHKLVNDVAHAYGFAEILADGGGDNLAENQDMLNFLVESLQLMTQHIQEFGRIVRFETKDTPGGLTLDLDRSIE